MPARGNEKPDAEGTVKAVQRRFATPVPRVADLDELNTFFRSALRGGARNAWCIRSSAPSRSRTAWPRTSPRPSPPQASVRSLRDPPRSRRGQVPDGRLRRQPVQRAPAVRVPDGDRQGLRRPGRDRGRRPGRRDAHSQYDETGGDIRSDPLSGDLGPQARRTRPPPTFRDWSLPACFADFRRALEGLHGATAGAGGSCGSCNSWASIPCPACAKPLKNANANISSILKPSSSGRGHSP